MKRRFFLLIILLLSCSAVFAATKTQTKGISIQAGYQDFADLRITPIASQSEAYLIGMPFNIEENYVQYNADSSGRVIARWSVLSNARFTLEITEISPLINTTDKVSNIELPYILTFDYDISYSMDGIDNNSLSGFWRVVYGDDTTYRFILPSQVVSSENFFIGSVAGNISFMFQDEMELDGVTRKVTDVVRSDDAPPGSYYALVKITIKTEEGGNP